MQYYADFLSILTFYLDKARICTPGSGFVSAHQLHDKYYTPPNTSTASTLGQVPKPPISYWRYHLG